MYAVPSHFFPQILFQCDKCDHFCTLNEFIKLSVLYINESIYTLSDAQLSLNFAGVVKSWYLIWTIHYLDI